MPVKLKPAVGYIRMSTDRQEDSPARQRRDIEALATRMGFRIVAWYEDHGLTGTDSANRPEFLRLLEDAKTGKFTAMLISEQSRMSREDIFDAMLHWRCLRDAAHVWCGHFIHDRTILTPSPGRIFAAFRAKISANGSGRSTADHAAPSSRGHCPFVRISRIPELHNSN